MRLFAALGPGDIVGAARKRLARSGSPTTSVAFSEQFLAYCNEAKIEALAISSNRRIDRLQDGLVSIENRSNSLHGKSGVLFHVATVFYAFYLALRAWRFGADIAIIDSGTTHYFALAFFKLFGIPVAVNLHNVLWPPGFPPKRTAQRIIRRLNAIFFRRLANGAIGVSPECERQLLSEATSRIPFFQYRCQFLADGFQPSFAYNSGPFHIAYVGRAEAHKGILDIVNIAEILRSRLATPVIFHVCGEGPDLPQMQTLLRKKNLDSTIVVHGHLARPELLKVYSTCHAVIVPTRSSFTEGMPQVCAEAMIVSLPVVASTVTNTVDVIGRATLQAETDNVESYVDKISSLVQNRLLYGTLREACAPSSKQFFDRSQSYPAALDRLIGTLFPEYHRAVQLDSLFSQTAQFLPDRQDR